MKVSMVEVVENYWTGYIILENHFQVNNASQIGLSYEQKLRDGELRRKLLENNVMSNKQIFKPSSA